MEYSTEIKPKISLLKDLEEAKDALAIATGKINSLEDDHINLKSKLLKYSGTLKVLNRKRKNIPAASENGSATEIVKDIRKKLSESESRVKGLLEQVANLQSLQSDETDSIENKFKKANDDLTCKIKDLKKAESDLRKAEKM